MCRENDIFLYNKVQGLEKPTKTLWQKWECNSQKGEKIDCPLEGPYGERK